MNFSKTSTEKLPKLRINRFTVVSISVILAMTLAILCIFYWLYTSSRDGILASWRDESGRNAQKVIEYLKTPMDAIAFSAITLEGMMNDPERYNKASSYLISETAIYSGVVSDNTTGVYAYFKGRYLDGSGWEPPGGYDSKSRPWYVEAVQNKGAITLVQPYLNMQTGSMMMSISKMLSDGDSVVSMDIFLNGVQTLAEEIAKNPVVRAVIIVDEDGHILAHSDKTKIGMNLEKGSETDLALSRILKVEQGKRFSEFRENRLLFGDPVTGGWHILHVLDRDLLFGSLSSVYTASGFFLVFFMAICLATFLYFQRKNEQNRKLEDEIRAAASIYMAMYRIDIAADTVICIRDDAGLHDKIGDVSSFRSMMYDLPDTIAAEQSRSLLTPFLDPRTLEDRMKDLNSITHEFLDWDEKWVRVRFTVIRRYPSGTLKRVLFAFESIDEDKRRQENLKRLSETDLMTGVHNRGSGERLVRQLVSDGVPGLFCLMDADKFKYVNDNFGHDTGDKVIIALADCLKKTFRNTDVIFRLGGDEFCVFALNVQNTTNAEKIFSRFFEHINAITIQELKGHTISVSIGASFFPGEMDNFEALYHRADEGTYESKKASGNKFTIVS